MIMNLWMASDFTVMFLSSALILWLLLAGTGWCMEFLEKKMDKEQESLFLKASLIYLLFILPLLTGTTLFTMTYREIQPSEGPMGPTLLRTIRYHTFGTTSGLGNFWLFWLILAVWAVGFLYKGVYRRQKEKRMLKRLRNASCHLEEGWILELAGELCLELGVRRPVRFYISELVSSPFVEGTGTYHVILPGNIRDCGETELMLRHELTHCARGDLCYRRHLYWLCALYWFLPPVYGYAERFVEVNEMACDEAVLRSVPGKARYRYARLMYDLASENGERSFAETGFSFSGQKDSILERRMKSMVKMKKGMKRWKAAVLSAMLLTLCPATTLAAAGGVSRVQDVVARSMATELEENPIVVETYQEIYEADNYTLVKEAPDMDAMETNLVTRGVSTIDLTINGKVQISIAVVSRGFRR